jgi:serine/threonine-protein kinase
VAEKTLKEQPEDVRVLSALGLAHAGLGQKEEAIRYGKRAVELLPVSKDAFSGWHLVASLASIYLMIDEYDAALDQIEYLLSIPSWISVPLLRIDPTYDPVRNHPRFRQLLRKYELRETK